jgi:phenylalanyl-tRNA synthetase beta subunit
VALEEFSARFPAIAIEEDFVEEIARIHGYEHVPFARA